MEYEDSRLVRIPELRIWHDAAPHARLRHVRQCRAHLRFRPPRLQDANEPAHPLLVRGVSGGCRLIAVARGQGSSLLPRSIGCDWSGENTSDIVADLSRCGLRNVG